MRTEIIRGGAVALNFAALPPAGEPLAVQLSPFGEFPVRDGGPAHGAVQRCTRAAFEAMVAAWNGAGAPEVLVDVDHASAAGGSTEAAAWAGNLRVGEDGLYADFRLTPRGRGLVEGRAYRFVSPGWTLAPDGSPLSLCSVALTNRPNLPVKPVVNHETNQKGDPGMDLKKIAAALGLAETATEEEALAAIAAMTEASAKAAEEAADAKAEAFAENAVKAGKVAAGSKDAVKAAFRKSPEAAEAVLNALAAPPPPPPAPLPDFVRAKTPAALNARTPGADADPLAVYNAYAAMPDGPEKDAYLAANAARIEAGYAKSLNK